MKDRLFRNLRALFAGWLARLQARQVRTSLLQAVPFWVSSVLTGLLAVGYAKLFSVAESLAGALFRLERGAFFVLTPLCFGLGWWVVQRYAPYARGSGIPQVMAALDLNASQQPLARRLLSLRIILVKIISSLLMVLGYGIVGREGPTIQMAGSVFRRVQELLPAWWPGVPARTALTAGAASGLAAAFNTPLGGIVFAVEELTKVHFTHFRSALFIAVIVAGLTAQGLAGPYLYLGFPRLSHLTPLVYAGIGVVALLAGLSGGLMGLVLVRVLRQLSLLRQQRFMLYYVIFCSLVVAAMGYFLGEKVLGSGHDLMTDLLFTPEKRLPWYVPLFRQLGMLFSFTTGAAGGIFAPSLSAGASMGAVVAGWFHFGQSNTNLLILAGMVAFLSGVTRSPFTSAILVLEMTDRHSVIFHLMLAAVLATFAASLLDPRSIYDRLSEQYLRQLKND